MTRSLVGALLASSLLLAACGSPVDDAPVEVRNQYLQVARIAGTQAGLDVPDRDWLALARSVCGRQLRSEADYDALITEMERDAPSPSAGRAVKDVGRTAIQLFCPFE